MPSRVLVRTIGKSFKVCVLENFGVNRVGMAIAQGCRRVQISYALPTL